MELPRLTYFSSRGRAEPIRLLLVESGTPFEERSVGLYHPTEKTPAFLEVKASGKLAFDSLPLWEETDGFAVVESDAILRHLARTRGLYGASDREAALCDMIREGMKDIRAELSRLFSVEPPGRAAVREALVGEVLPRWLGYMDRILAKNEGGGGFIVGAQVTLADLSLYYLLESLTENELHGPLAALPRLAAFKERIAARPNLARYLASPERFPVQLLPR